jgi:hypothetical protein
MGRSSDDLKRWRRRQVQMQMRTRRSHTSVGWDLHIKSPTAMVNLQAQRHRRQALMDRVAAHRLRSVTTATIQSAK